MATLAYIRKAALALPGVVEIESHGGAWFNVGKKTFVLYWTPHKRWIFRLPKPRQELLFEALDAEEVPSLVADAWSTIVSKKVAKA